MKELDKIVKEFFEHSEEFIQKIKFSNLENCSIDKHIIDKENNDTCICGQMIQKSATCEYCGEKNNLTVVTNIDNNEPPMSSIKKWKTVCCINGCERGE